jgi:hypothetical protein
LVALSKGYLRQKAGKAETAQCTPQCPRYRHTPIQFLRLLET